MRLCQKVTMSRQLKRAHRELTIAEKVALIKEREKFPRQSCKKLGLKFAIGKSTVCDILKNKHVYLEAYEKNYAAHKQRLPYNGRFAEVNAKTLEWYKQARAKNVVINGPLLCLKAYCIAEELGISGFKASDGWLASFKARNNISSFKKSTKNTEGNSNTSMDNETTDCDFEIIIENAEDDYTIETDNDLTIDNGTSTDNSKKDSEIKVDSGTEVDAPKPDNETIEHIFKIGNETTGELCKSDDETSEDEFETDEEITEDDFDIDNDSETDNESKEEDYMTDLETNSNASHKDRETSENSTDIKV